MENKAHALAAGVFVLAVTALLVAMAVWLTREGGSRNEYALSTRDAVTGLQPQAGVRFKGVTVGKVSAIGFDPKAPGHVLVRIAVDTRAPVTTATFATLGYQGVTGIAFVQLDDPGTSTQALRSTDGEPPRIPLRAGLMGRLSDQGGQVLAQLEEASRRINQLLAPENQKVLVGAVGDAGAAARRVRDLAGHVDELLQAQLSPQRTNVPQLVQETRQAVAEVGQLVRRLNEQGGVVDKLGEGSAALARGAGTLNDSTLPRLHRVTDDAARAARQVNRAVGSLNDNPQALLYGSGAALPGPGEPGFVAPVPTR
jgi:phospholipid/cholesterol/gamma-HCH transport system substrate-binding protein